MLKTNKPKIKLVVLYFLDFITKLLFFPLFFQKLFSSRAKGTEFRKILILEPWGIGDLIIMSSILRGLREKLPDSKVSLLCGKDAEQIFGRGLFIDEYIKIKLPWLEHRGKYKIWRWDWISFFREIKKLRREKFDLILDARGDFRNNLLSFLIAGKRRLGFGWTAGGHFLTDIAQFDFRHRHRIEAWVNLCGYLGIDIKDPSPFVHVSQDCSRAVDALLIRHGIKNGQFLVGLHPGAGVKNKCWPLDRFAKVAEHVRDKFNAKIIVFLEPEGYGQDIPIKGEHLKLTLALPELIALIKRLNLLICNDGGVMHLSAAALVPVVAIFGSANPAWFGPCGKNHTLIFSQRYKCRPCFDRCKFKEPLCITDIGVEQVIGELDKKLQR